MSRKHPPIPDTDALTVTKAIGQRLHALREAGSVPAAIVMDESTATLFRAWGIGGWSYGRPGLLALPVEIDPRAEGWSVRVR